MIKGIGDISKVHDLPIEFLSSKEVSDLIPGTGLADEFLVAYQHDVGYLWELISWPFSYMLLSGKSVRRSMLLPRELILKSPAVDLASSGC